MSGTLVHIADRLRLRRVKTAFITGVTGQDGSYLAELLLDKGYDVHGLVRRSSMLNRTRIDHLHHHDRLHLHYGDLTDGVSLVNLVRSIEPDEVYNLGAMSHVKVSFEMPDYTASTNAIGTLRLLEAIRAAGLDCRFYQASTSEMFGSTPPPQDEDSKFHPRSPYGSSKLQAHWVTVNYREAYGLFAVSGILFNHESPRRGENFVTRKITKAVAAIDAGVEDHVDARQPRRRARLGLRPGVRRGHVADAPAGRARRLRAGHRRGPLGARVLRGGVRPRRAGLGGPRALRRELHPPGRGRRARSATRPRPTASSAGRRTPRRWTWPG